jgi:hypothetical protein
MIQTTDIVFAAFEQFPHSSNTLAKAAALEKLVIVSSGYCMAQRVSSYHLGEIIDEGNTIQCVNALNKIRNNYELYKKNAKFKEYSSVHSIEKMHMVFQRMLNESR